MSDVEKYEVNRYNIIDYLKKNQLTFAPVPDNIISSIMTTFNNKKSLYYVAVYVVLYTRQDEYNNDTLTTRLKYKKYFNATDRVIAPIIKDLESEGFIRVEYKNRKKVIFVKYPEFANDILSNKKVTLERKILETKTITTETTERVIIEDQPQQNTIETIYLESDAMSIPRYDNNYLDGYIEYSNKVLGSVIKNPVGFKTHVHKYPNKYNFKQYDDYLVKKEKIRLKEEQQKEKNQRKIEKEKQQKADELQRKKNIAFIRSEIDPKELKQITDEVYKEENKPPLGEIGINTRVRIKVNEILLEKYKDII